MVQKVLLARFTREKADGKEGDTETLMPGPANLTKDDMATLDKLTKSTGKQYYRDPINEVPEGSETGVSDVSVDDMTAAQLRDYLDENDIEYPSGAKKPDLLALAKGEPAGDEDGAEKDAGL